MADLKISALTSGAPALAGDEFIIARGGSNYKLTYANLEAVMDAATAAKLTSATTINGTSFDGSTPITITANTPNTLTLGTGLTGTSFNGSTNVTAAVSYGTTSGTACQGNDSRLSDSRQATNTNTQLASLGVGTAASGTSGEIRATNNVTAYYSDARLKDFRGKIGDALHKVGQLNGYYFTENAKAEEFGYHNKELQVGVSAQEVQAVLPEVIAAAPFDIDESNQSKSGENYITVRYEKLVPLLIEAIKELSAKVEALEGKK
jgi:hypothetical protein